MERNLPPVTMGSPEFVTMELGPFRVSEARFPPSLVLAPHVHERPIVAVIIEGSWEQRDYVLNAGGLIQLVVREVLHQRRVAPWIGNIQRTVHQVLMESLRDRLPPLIVANRMALEKIGT